LYFYAKPRVTRYRVFGCPAIVKVYARKATATTPTGSRTLNPKNIIQRGVRGIFVGFPVDQAGWLIYVPSSGHLITSADVVFDEDFLSTLAYNDLAFHDAMPTRYVGYPYDATLPLVHTGPPPIPAAAFTTSDSPWAPYTALSPTSQPPTVDFDVAHTDLIDLSPTSLAEEGEAEEGYVQQAPTAYDDSDYGADTHAESDQAANSHLAPLYTVYDDVDPYTESVDFAEPHQVADTHADSHDLANTHADSHQVADTYADSHHVADSYSGPHHVADSYSEPHHVTNAYSGPNLDANSHQAPLYMVYDDDDVPDLVQGPIYDSDDEGD
jgi:hypothetical protein